MTTLSRKKVISTNKCLTNTEFPLEVKERRQQWKWARTSEEVKHAKQIHKEFLETVRNSKKLSLKKKEALKKKKEQRMFKLLDLCKSHGGPVTDSSLGLIDTLNEKQLINEICYLRATVAPNIRQQKRIQIEGKYKMKKFSKDELKIEIKNAIKPEIELNKTVEKLLKAAFEIEE